MQITKNIPSDSLVASITVNDRCLKSLPCQHHCTVTFVGQENAPVECTFSAPFIKGLITFLGEEKFIGNLDHIKWERQKSPSDQELSEKLMQIFVDYFSV